jgi:hypothetical protein
MDDWLLEIRWGEANCLLRIGSALMANFVSVNNEMGRHLGYYHKQHTEVGPNCGLDVQALLVDRLCLTGSSWQITLERVVERIEKDDFVEFRPNAPFDFGQG